MKLQPGLLWTIGAMLQMDSLLAMPPDSISVLSQSSMIQPILPYLDGFYTISSTTGPGCHYTCFLARCINETFAASCSFSDWLQDGDLSYGMYCLGPFDPAGTPQDNVDSGQALMLRFVFTEYTQVTPINGTNAVTVGAAAASPYADAPATPPTLLLPVSSGSQLLNVESWPQAEDWLRTLVRARQILMVQQAYTDSSLPPLADNGTVANNLIPERSSRSTSPSAPASPPHAGAAMSAALSNGNVEPQVELPATADPPSMRKRLARRGAVPLPCETSTEAGAARSSSSAVAIGSSAGNFTAAPVTEGTKISPGNDQSPAQANGEATPFLGNANVAPESAPGGSDTLASLPVQIPEASKDSPPSAFTTPDGRTILCNAAHALGQVMDGLASQLQLNASAAALSADCVAIVPGNSASSLFSSACSRAAAGVALAASAVFLW